MASCASYKSTRNIYRSSFLANFHVAAIAKAYIYMIIQHVTAVPVRLVCPFCWAGDGLR
ncbi:uncharacterized protein BDV17DRAFT_253375 [Aspergillus undulatus]|uniref:uncharacterized protein n=1 Tax=Aspergillus undulatus TaxID=1810928 RepID=UPI003CCDFC51